MNGHDPRAVARTMIERAEALDIELTHLKLQKLLYLAHGVMLAKYGRPLVTEPFRAWRYGPVLEPLYHELKIFGPGPVGSKHGFIPRWPSLPEDATREIEVIDDVLRQCGEMTAGRLVGLSHDPNGPWYAVYNAETQAPDIGIDDNAIESYFRTLIVPEEEGSPATSSRRR